MPRPPITLVPHSHWDREWYLPFEGFRERLIPLLDEVLDLLDHGYPHYHLDGQTAMVDDYLAIRPDREQDIRRHVEAGRLSVGPWVSLVDEFLVSGETIVRDLELGLARARELGGAMLVGYLPDQFGHFGQMPQLLTQAGIDRALVWRGVPAEIERGPFWWESPDGSRVLTEYLPFGYSLGGHLRDLEGEALDTALDELGELLAPWTARGDVIVMTGFDHAPVDSQLPQRIAHAHDVEIGTLAAYVERPPPGGLQTWRGELRSAARAHLLPGVYSARVDQKSDRGQIEALVERYAEPLAALVPGFAWPQRELDHVWRLLVLNGAHDSICGCSVDEVAHAVDERHAEARAQAERIVDAALTSLGEQVRDAGLLRFNPSPFARDGVPGLGWCVGDARDSEAVPVASELRDGWIAAAGVELTLTDEPDHGDLYNFDPAGDVAHPTLTLFGDDVGATFGGDLDVRLAFSRGRDEPFVRLDVTIENARPDHRLRLRIRLPETADGALAASPFELVSRPFVSEGGDLEAPSPTWPAHGAVLASGLAVLAEGVFEYEATEHELAVTLLRCVGTISRATLTTRPSPAGPDVATPEAQMLGTTRWSLAVLPNADRSTLVREWERFALPLLDTTAAGGGALPRSGSLLEVAGAELSSIRRRDGALEVRLWNAGAAPATAAVGGAAVELGPAAIATVRAP